jgi:hypothetical protein
LVVGQVPKVGTGIFELIVENQAEWIKWNDGLNTRIIEEDFFIFPYFDLIKNHLLILINFLINI